MQVDGFNPKNILFSRKSLDIGYGSYLTESGDVELDATIMEGAELAAGAATIVKNVKHPITYVP